MSPIRKCAATLTMVSLLASCGMVDADLLTGGKKIVVVNAPEPKKEEEPKDAESMILDPSRLARRLALDLTLRLPEAADLTKLKREGREALIQSLLSRSEASQAIAELHSRMWHLNEDDLPDLDHMVEKKEDQDHLSAQMLSPQLRRSILKEPLLIVQTVLAERRHLSALLTASVTVIPRDAADFWGLIQEEPNPTLEPYRLARYQDSRPKVGILSANGWLSAFHGRKEEIPLRRTAGILREITCATYEQRDAHRFADISQADLEAHLSRNFSTMTLENATCGTCHRAFSAAAPAFRGLGGSEVKGTAASLAGWRTYQAPSDPTAGSYRGQGFANLPELADLIAKDPAFLQCEIQKLTSALLQKSTTLSELAEASQVHDQVEKGVDLLTALTPLLVSQRYALAPINPKTKSDSLRSATGVKMLGRQHFEALITAYAPELLSTSVTYLETGLDPGREDLSGGDDRIPGGSYVHLVERVARQLAHAIVTSELTPPILAASRLVLRDLPNNSGFGAEQSAVETQIQTLWTQLTGQDLIPGSDHFKDLLTLWNSLDPYSSETNFRLGWEVMLTAIFTSPDFLTY